MTDTLNIVIAYLNAWGEPFCQYAWTMLIQSSLLIGALLVADALLRRRVRAVVRYGLWLLVLVKLVLPPSLTSPVSVGNWVDEVLARRPPVATAITTPPLGSAMLYAFAKKADIAIVPSVSLGNDATILPVEGAAEKGLTVRTLSHALPLQWQGGLLLGWAAGVLVLGAMLLQRGLLCRRLLVRAQPTNGSLSGLLGECCAAVELDRRKVRLKLADEMMSPAVCGILWPTILLPAYLIDKLNGEQMRTVLAHELAHIKRHDLLVNLAQTILQIVYFYNPLLWLANGIIRRVREQAVDETVLVTLGQDAAGYSRTLIDIAEQAFHRPALSLRLIGVVESKTALAQRIRHILSHPLPRSAKVGVAGMMGIALVAALLLPMAKGKNSVDNVPSASTKNALVQKVESGQPSGETNAPIKGVLRGKIVDTAGKPVAQAIVGLLHTASRSTTAFGRDTGMSDSRRSDIHGRFEFNNLADGKRDIRVFHHNYRSSILRDIEVGRTDVKIVLDLTCRYSLSGRVVDSSGNPVPEAEVIVGDLLESQTPLTMQKRTSHTDRSGNFAFREQFDPVSENRRWIYAHKDGYGFSGQWHDASGFETNVTIELLPPVTIKGRVTDSVGQPIAGAEIAFFSFERPDQRPHPFFFVLSTNADFVPLTRTAYDGAFTLGGVPGSGKVALRVTRSGYECLGIRDVVTTENEALWINNTMHPFGEPLNIVLRRGATLRGTVVREDTGEPVAGLYVAIRGRDQGPTCKTDAKGRFEFVDITPSPLNVLAMFDKTPEQGLHEWTASALEIKDIKPGETREGLRIVATKGGIVKGHVRDSAGKPLAGINVVFYSAAYPRSAGAIRDSITTGEDGSWSYRFPAGPVYVTIISESWQPKSYDLDLKKDQTIEHVDFQLASNNLVGLDPWSDLRAQPTVDPLAKTTVPTIPPNSLSGQVVNSNGAPVKGVRLDNLQQYGHGQQPPIQTDAQGMFSMTNLDKSLQTVAIQFSKAGFSPMSILRQPIGKMIDPVVLTQKTYFEGIVTSPDGKPVPGATIRAVRGLKRIVQGSERLVSFMIGEKPTEAVTDAQGEYRLYVQQDSYDFQVQVPAIGVARLRNVRINQDEAKHLDIALTTGVVFRARVLDSVTQQPIKGVVIETERQHENKGQSNTNGLVEIPGLMLGPCEFSVKAAGYARWWSQQCIKEQERSYVSQNPESVGWQMNSGWLSFDLRDSMTPVTIIVERGAKIRGKVLDPDGNPVSGARVVPALTGTGNSFTYDNSFPHRTREDGTFEILLPASKDREYNLVAHDGDWLQWRKWANGVTPPFRTDPGQNLDDMIIRLNRPGAVKGTVVDREGKPVADREVRAADVDKFENPDWEPQIRSDKDGKFELGFVRPGKHYIQVAPFHTPPEYASKITTRIVTVEAGQTVDNVRLTAVPE